MQYISVVEYDPAWREKFEREAGLFKNILKDELVAVHHIGSTAVPGLKAKPVIDIMPVVKDIARIDGLRRHRGAAFFEKRRRAPHAQRAYLRRFFALRDRAAPRRARLSARPPGRGGGVRRTQSPPRPAIPRRYRRLLRRQGRFREGTRKKSARICRLFLRFA